MSFNQHSSGDFVQVKNPNNKGIPIEKWKMSIVCVCPISLSLSSVDKLEANSYQVKCKLHIKLCPR